MKKSSKVAQIFFDSNLTWEGAGITRGSIGSVEIGVRVGGVQVGRIGFRLSQAKRGYGENYDLEHKEKL